MANEQMIQSIQLKRSFDLLDESAIEIYETREALELAVQALEDIVATPNSMASDSRAIKEMVRIAIDTLNKVVEK
jgi:hypothetical protein